MRHFLIGDIHGCYDELREHEELARGQAIQAKQAPFFVSVGDLIDRGPSTRDVLEHYYRGVSEGTHAAILGNHEECLLQTFWHFRPDLFAAAGITRLHPALQTLAEQHAAKKWVAYAVDLHDFATTAKTLWLGQGGAETVRSLGGESTDPSTWNIAPNLLKWLNELPLYWEAPRAVATHALAARENLEAVRAGSGAADYVRHAHEAIWSRQVPRRRPDTRRVHFSGHTPTDEIAQHLKGAVIQIDTGCVYGRQLTAYCLETKRVIAVKSRTRWAMGK